LARPKRFETLGPQFLLPYTGAPLDFAAAFGRDAPVVLEIGFGMGEATAHIAALMPETNFLCCEVHEPGVGACSSALASGPDQHPHPGARRGRGAGPHAAPHSLDGVHIFFPDPWHKKKHNKRRLIQPELVVRLAQRLQPDGYLHCATDWEPYARQMMAGAGRRALLRNTAEDFAPKPDYRPLTKFENRGLKLGHGVWDLVFKRV
jgi:tRNA (guanine-N7-)-methyltransferase